MSAFTRRGAALVMGVALLAFACGASAQTRGAYAGGAIGQATVSDGCGVVAAGVSCDEASTAWKLLAGYQIGRNFAVEAGFSRLSDRDAGSGAGAATSRSNALEAVVLGGNPLTEKLSIFGKFGLFTARTRMTSAAGTANETSSNVTFGFGARYDMAKSWGLRADWQRYKSVGGDAIGTSDISLLSLGAIVKF